MSNARKATMSRADQSGSVPLSGNGWAPAAIGPGLIALAESRGFLIGRAKNGQVIVRDPNSAARLITRDQTAAMNWMQDPRAPSMIHKAA